MIAVSAHSSREVSQVGVAADTRLLLRLVLVVTGLAHALRVVRRLFVGTTVDLFPRPTSFGFGLRGLVHFLGRHSFYFARNHVVLFIILIHNGSR